MKYIPHFFGFLGLLLLIIAAAMYFDIPSSKVADTITNIGPGDLTAAPTGPGSIYVAIPTVTQAYTTKDGRSITIPAGSECIVTDVPGGYQFDCTPKRGHDAGVAK